MTITWSYWLEENFLQPDDLIHTSFLFMILSFSCPSKHHSLLSFLAGSFFILALLSFFQSLFHLSVSPFLEIIITSSSLDGYFSSMNPIRFIVLVSRVVATVPRTELVFGLIVLALFIIVLKEFVDLIFDLFQEY